MSKTILVTGGCGFIGSNFVNRIAKQRQPIINDKVNIVVVDKLTYAGNRDNIKDVPHKFYQYDITNVEQMTYVFDQHKFDGIFHFAAESHVDRSIDSSSEFLMTNVIGTQVLLDLVKRHWSDYKNGRKFIHVSTDEVYGSLTNTDQSSKEGDVYKPNSPYSASKAASDLLVRSYVKTHDVPAIITHCTNNYGKHQHLEKFIPTIIRKALKDEKIPVYGKGDNIRDWVHVNDHCDSLWGLYTNGEIGQTYNIGGNNERTNISIVIDILRMMGKSLDLIDFVDDRKGHDFRYSVNTNKIEHLLGVLNPCKHSSFHFNGNLMETIQYYKEKLNG
tara:strand:+ start:6562 stop:7554 length:993 start_codon:yes stop_codon:yes gene_type:complete